MQTTNKSNISKSDKTACCKYMLHTLLGLLSVVDIVGDIALSQAMIGGISCNDHDECHYGYAQFGYLLLICSVIGFSIGIPARIASIF